MAEEKVWLVTGAGRGLGVDIVKVALAVGHAVVATGRDPEKVAAAFDAHDDQLTFVALDVTDPDSAVAAVRSAVDRFGRLDVVVSAPRPDDYPYGPFGEKQRGRYVDSSDQVIKELS